MNLISECIIYIFDIFVIFILENVFRIASLPPEMGQLYSLEFLSLVDNPIAHIPESLTQLNLLKDVRTNATLTIPPEVVETRV